MSTEITSEDALCLNVLLASNVQAIRIDESTMTVHALTDRGEATVALHPDCRHDQYLRLVRETLSEHALDSPGGYPVYLRRWSRMGQLRDETLPQLLLTGEPEAVIAVVYAAGLTDEIARRAWWIMPTAEIARRMLEKPAVAEGQMGKVLADFLVEHLPFEEDHYAIIETIRFLLHTGLVDDTTRERLWKKGRYKNAYYVGFLEQSPDRLPGLIPARSDIDSINVRLEQLVANGNTVALQINRIFSNQGQTFLSTCEEVLRHPATQDVVNILLNALGNYFRSGLSITLTDTGNDINICIQKAEQVCEAAVTESSCPEVQIRELLTALPQLQPEVRAMLVLSTVSSGMAEPIFARTTAIGTLMRTKLEPVTFPLFEQIAILRGKSA
ncbi:sulfur reduction protein DsrS [Sulfurirhabdus autotrophica]|uniref:Sulfur reduction protein DsrS n=1 Tax=Sulfurirhabdus autotrophica TaxID=1706046 RepID=A0A4R3XU32_9PROT|nr:sulfur reduction protein DsrS [Sulfurirhabdus autotrophica]TCV82377.1 hypothetical protein EDC63_12111 [Sulfurirhabdus autotrophica]